MITVRIPELSPRTPGVDLSLSDRLPFWDSIADKTRWVDLGAILSLFISGGGGTSHAPIAYGGSVIYRVPEGIAPGTTSVSTPSLAGKDFLLRRGGFPLEALLPDNSNVATAEYDILDAGGFQLLKDGDELAPEEVFELFIFSLVAGSTVVTGPTGGSGFIQGKKLVTTNVTLDVANDMNKVIQVRASGVSVTITIPSVEDIPVNSFIPIETSINNSKPTKIQTTGGQFIYLKNKSFTSVFMHPGETLWLFRDDDGLYCINDFYQNYKDIGKPVASYRISADDNEILCKGQLVTRADYPRLWEYAALGASLISDSDWGLASTTIAGRTVPRPNRGCFSTGDGSTTFRLPDLMNVALRGLLSESGSDSQRYLNKPGGFQLNELLAHAHNIPDGFQKWGGDSGGQQGADDTSDDHSAPNTDNYGGSETRMDNVGIFYVMKY